MTSLTLVVILLGELMVLPGVVPIPSGATYASPEEQYRDTCINMYSRYCSLMTPDQCYVPHNQRLCCATCAEFSQRFGFINEEESCLFGDRNTTCGDMPTNECYNPESRYTCCGSCESVSTRIQGCGYGDKKLHICSKVKAPDCYDGQTSETCCGSCDAHYTGIRGCEYGDRMQFFRKGRRRYSCAAYVGYFGYSRCRFSWDEDFQRACCGTCARRPRSKFNRISRRIVRYPYPY